MPSSHVDWSVDQWFANFAKHLRDARGLRPGSCRIYERHVRDFLAHHFGRVAACKIDDIGPAHVWDFIKIRCARPEGSAIKTVSPALRSFLRYVAMLGVCDASLVKAVPSVPKRRLSNLPKVLSHQQIDGLLRSFASDTPTGRRDYAIALCLTRLGLRAGEVAQLTLDDLDWRASTLCVRAAKQRRVSVLPLCGDVATAIVAYVQSGRPVTTDRHVFVQHRLAPHPGQALNGGSVRRVIARAWERCGIPVPSQGTHALRHTLATDLLAAGADLKDIADVLRHRNLDTTMIYAKVDRQHLVEVLQPWPGTTGASRFCDAGTWGILLEMPYSGNQDSGDEGETPLD